MDVRGCEVDLAVGCSYKFLNGGPGAPAFLYVAKAHQATLSQPISGWMGHARPFAFAPQYAPAPGITRALSGTPPIVALAALEASLELWQHVDLELVWAKSAAMTELFIRLVDQHCTWLSLTLDSPREPARRGSHVAYHHLEAYAVIQAGIARGVIGDFRDPDLMRFGFTPLYLRYADVWDAAEAIAEILKTGEWDREEYKERTGGDVTANDVH